METTADRRAFLTARWSNLALLTYAVDPGVLEPLLPPECRLDLRDGKAFVSLVAFDFLHTRVMGISWPGFRNFPEINLRFYVRHGEDRGVSFVREFVPQRAVALLAKLFYNEPYHAAAMTSEVDMTPATIQVEHRLQMAGKANRVKVIASAEKVIPAADSIEHFFKEHSWGYGTSRRGALVQYNVAHPVWEIWRVQSFELDWDWRGVYGEQWGFLQEASPVSIILAVGSEVSVFPKNI